MNGVTERSETSSLEAVLRKAVERAPHPVAAIDVPTRKVIAVSPVLSSWFPGVDLIGRDLTEFAVGGPSEALGLLTSGRLDGYELTRAVRFPAGPGDAVVWVHAVGNERPPRLAVVVADLADTTLQTVSLRSVPSATVIGTVDNEWRIDRASADAQQLLGQKPEQLMGVSFLSLVHPGDLAELWSGLGHAQAVQGGVSVRLRLRHANSQWRWCRARVAPLGERAGFAFVLSPLTIDLVEQDRLQELEHRLARIAHEVHSANNLRGAGTLPALADLPDLGKLTTREWEIVMRLREGDRIEQVAKRLYLSPSTVRNHLTAIYRKLGVRGQSELLVLLLSEKVG